MQTMQAYHSWVQEELKRSVEFWSQYGIDHENGGVYTCLDKTGKIYSTDKSVWMQGRCAWTYAYLCTNYGKREEWLEISRSCLDFMEAHCNVPLARVTIEITPHNLTQSRYDLILQVTSDGHHTQSLIPIVLLTGGDYQIFSE